MTDGISTLWQDRPPDNIRKLIGSSLSPGPAARPLQVFFRADDIGRPDERFSRLMQLFAAHRMPLCLAVVPAWINPDNWREMEQFSPQSFRWCWHQHGWEHGNHELMGKKCEFGPSRKRKAISQDLARGRLKLAEILGKCFLPVFTPPWNRCSLETLEELKKQEFLAVSRYASARPSAPAGLPDLAVNVDLHTRRERDFSEGWDRLLAEIGTAAASGRIGFMIHHDRMNDSAFAFLDILLQELQDQPTISCCTFRELLEITPG